MRRALFLKSLDSFPIWRLVSREPTFRTRWLLWSQSPTWRRLFNPCISTWIIQLTALSTIGWFMVKIFLWMWYFLILTLMHTSDSFLKSITTDLSCRVFQTKLMMKKEKSYSANSIRQSKHLLVRWLLRLQSRMWVNLIIQSTLQSTALLTVPKIMPTVSMWNWIRSVLPWSMSHLTMHRQKGQRIFWTSSLRFTIRNG